MKKIVKKSPFKLTPEEKAAQEKKSNSTTVVKGAKPGYGAIVSQSNTSRSAGSKLTNANPTTGTIKTTVPGKKSTANVDALNKQKIYRKDLEGYGLKHPKARAAANKRRAEAIAKDAAASTKDKVIETPAPPAPRAESNTDDNSNNSGTTDIEETTKQGTTALDVRGDNRKIKVATRESANASKNIVKFEEKAKNTTNLKKKAKFEAKAAGNRTKLQYNQEVLGHAEEAGRQGSTGNRMVTTSKDISNARITAQNKGLVEGSNSQSSSNNGFVAPKETVSTDSGLIKKKEDSPAAMVKSSVLKMFKPGSFKMGGFGTKSKK